MIFKNSLSASWPVCELSSPRLDWPRVGLSASCPVSYRDPENKHGVWVGARLKQRNTKIRTKTIVAPLVN